MLATAVVTPLYGKLGDLYGRKLIIQCAIALFLTGSVLCGLSQSMGQLIAFRAIQGPGGGGLMVTSMAAVGDLISPRERGRYQGYFGAVFGVSTVSDSSSASQCSARSPTCRSSSRLSRMPVHLWQACK